MYSIAFLLCSILLLSSVIADDETTIVSNDETTVNPDDEFIKISQDDITTFPDNEFTIISHDDTTIIFDEDTAIESAEEAIVALSKDPIHIEIGKRAAAAGMKVLNDLLDGKPLERSLFDRAIEALSKVKGAAASMLKSFVKRVRELRDGEKIEVVAGRVWKAVNRTFVGKNKQYAAVLKIAGEENIQSFIEKATRIVRISIETAIAERKKELEAQKEKEK